MVILDSAWDALEVHRNFNLSEVHILNYYNGLPKTGRDERIDKNMKESLKTRDRELLLAAIEAEMERLGVEKIKLMRREVIATR